MKRLSFPIRFYSLGVGRFSLLGALALTGPQIRAKASEVTSNSDSGTGSLRDTILNSASGATVTFNASLSGQTIALSTGELLIDKNITLDASMLPVPVTLDAGGNSRVLRIAAGGRIVILDSLKITGGRTPDVANGNSQSGGGIFNEGGTLTILNSTISGNATGNAGNNESSAAGNGGGIYSQGALTIVHSIVSGNSTGNGSYEMGVSFPDYSDGGDGGGIFGSGSLTLSQTIVSGNSCGDGGGYFTGGSGGSGGGIYLSSGNLNIAQSTVSENSAGDGGGGVLGGGSGGYGGGLCIASGVATITRSSVHGNHAGPGIFGGYGGYGGGGGGIYSAGTLSLSLCTLSGNTSGGGGAASFYGGDGGDGGGISTSGVLTLSYSTISRNSTGVGGSSDDDGGDGSGGSGGGVSYSQGNVSLENTIVAGNSSSGSGPDIYHDSGGYISTAGANLLSTLSASGLSPGPTLSVGSALLAPLGNYGGPTKTMPPLPASPAIDAAVGAFSGPTDQRGFARPNGPLPDIGAVEAHPLGTLGLASNDGDAIPDILEGMDGPYPQLNPSIDDSSRDTDGDGSTDAEELANMTNLNDANDVFRILSFSKAPGFDSVTNPVFDITFRTFPGLNYGFERQSDLSQPFVSYGVSTAAGNFITSSRVTLVPGGGFVRVKRE